MPTPVSSSSPYKSGGEGRGCLLGMVEAGPVTASAVGSHHRLCQRLALRLSLWGLGHGGVQASARGRVGLEGAIWKWDGKKVLRVSGVGRGNVC